MDIPATLDTAKFRQLVLQGIGSLSGGGSGAATSTNTAVGPDGVTRVPLQVNADGELKVNVEASINADLTLIEGKLDTIIGIETPQAADVSAIKTKLNNSIAVTGAFYQATQPVSLASVPSHAVTNAGTFAVQNTAATPAGTNFIGSVNPDSTGSGSVTTSVPFVVTVTNSGTLAFQSDAAATGNVTIEASVDGTNYTATTYTALTTGNTSSSFNAATATIGQIDTSGFKNIRFKSNTIVGTVGITYNLSKNVSNVMLDNPLPAGSNVIGQVTANAGTNLNTSALALESGGNLATVATKMSDGLQKTLVVNGANTLAVDSGGAITANNTASTSYTYTLTGAIAANTVVIGPITCNQFREFAISATSVGAGGSLVCEISNDNTTWVAPLIFTLAGSISNSGIISAVGFNNLCTLGALYFRIRVGIAYTSGTTTLAVIGVQQPFTKSVTAVNITGSSLGNLATSNIPSPANYAGFSLYHTLVSAASTNATLVKNSNGVIGTLILTNTAATWAYFKLVNKTTAPTTGTDTAVINIGVAPNTTLDCSTAFAGLRMSTGVAYYVSGGSSLTDNTALATAGTFLVNMTYV
jgi:hypothetical protein